MMGFLLSMSSEENPTPNVEHEHPVVPKRTDANRELLLQRRDTSPLPREELRVC